MLLIGKELLDDFCRKHTDSAQALKTWRTLVELSVWKSPHDIKRLYSSASFLSGNRVIFNIRGNHYRLVVRVRYLNGILFILWIGTHAEYDKQNFEADK